MCRRTPEFFPQLTEALKARGGEAGAPELLEFQFRNTITLHSENEKHEMQNKRPCLPSRCRVSSTIYIYIYIFSTFGYEAIHAMNMRMFFGAARRSPPACRRAPPTDPQKTLATCAGHETSSAHYRRQRQDSEAHLATWQALPANPRSPHPDTSKT